MAYDKVFYYDKINHIRHELGEIQTNFNLNIVIDGDNNILDGAHRASIVCFTDGCDKKVKVLRVFN